MRKYRSSRRMFWGSFVLGLILISGMATVIILDPRLPSAEGFAFLVMSVLATTFITAGLIVWAIQLRKARQELLRYRDQSDSPLSTQFLQYIKTGTSLPWTTFIDWAVAPDLPERLGAQMNALLSDDEEMTRLNLGHFMVKDRARKFIEMVKPMVLK